MISIRHKYGLAPELAGHCARGPSSFLSLYDHHPGEKANMHGLVRLLWCKSSGSSMNVGKTPVFVSHFCLFRLTFLWHTRLSTIEKWPEKPKLTKYISCGCRLFRQVSV